MFDIKKILTRSWQILWNYRVLWVFGFMLALAAGGADFGNTSNYRTGDGDNQPSGQGWNPEGWEGDTWEELEGDTPGEKLGDVFRQFRAVFVNLQEDYPEEFRLGVAVAITAFVVVLLFGTVVTVLRYVAETAAIKMVDEYEGSGVKVGFRQGWRYGWSRTAWRVFLLDFLVNLPNLVLFVVLALIGWWIFSAFMSGVQWNIISSLIGGIGLAFLFIFVTVVLMVILYVLRDLAWRMIVLDGAGVREGLRNSFALARRQWRNVGLMWLVMIGLRIAWGVVFIVLVIPLFVVSLITLAGSALASLLPFLLTAGVSALLSAPDFWPWVFAGIVSAPLFFVLGFSPIILVSGWWQIYRSSAWTLTYRELKALEKVGANGGTEPGEGVELAAGE